MEKFLRRSEYIDFDHPLVLEKAAWLAVGASGQEDLVRRCFEFVRDSIRHSQDFQCSVVTAKASEVLEQQTGFCYAKSHLLAALLRANNVPAGLCYQRLAINDAATEFCLHGLNAVYLAEHGWYRLDPRGNKPGVTAGFCPPQEKLAFVCNEHEYDLPEIWDEPLPVVVRALENHRDVAAVAVHLPDVEIWRLKTQS